ncbi:hypothetical protein HZH68_016491 [Vespula germanica]|uniref:Uncharacterized protein n=1 Tax=Vespula germanica TaxID=30212 RepID=A0A834J7W4_VESGE|nr:hypothetical protein HZH68_016491 [Vespula germanica]
MASPSTPLPFADKGASEGRQAGIQIGKQARKQASKWTGDGWKYNREHFPSTRNTQCFSRLPRTPLAYASYRMKEGWIGKRVSHRQGRRIVERILRKIVRVHSVLCNFDADEKKYFG